MNDEREGLRWSFNYHVMYVHIADSGARISAGLDFQTLGWFLLPDKENPNDNIFKAVPCLIARPSEAASSNWTSYQRLLKSPRRLWVELKDPRWTSTHNVKEFCCFGPPPTPPLHT